MDEKTQAEWVQRTYARGKAREYWTSKRDQGLRAHENALVQNHLKDPASAIVTIGCGSGRETFALYEMGFKNVCGVDLCEELLEAARARSQRDSLPIPFIKANLTELPFADGSFDVATMFFNVYGHIVPREARLRSLREIRRVLRPGGLVLFDVNSYYISVPHWGVNLLRDLVRLAYNPGGWERGDKKWSTQVRNETEDRSQVVCSHVFRPAEVRQEVAAAGFDVIQATAVKDIVLNVAAQSTWLLGKGPQVYAFRKAAEPAGC